MIDHLRKVFIVLALAALVAPVSDLCPGAQRSPDNLLQSLKHYEEQTSTRDFTITNEYSEKARKDWLSLYGGMWRSKNLDATLRQIVDKAVDTQLEQAGYWEMAKGLVYEKVFQELLKSSINESMAAFSPRYEEFLEDLVAPYSDSLGKMLSRYAEDIGTIRREEAKALPGYAALLPMSVEPAVARLQVENRTPSLKAPIRPESMASGVAGVSILAMRKVLQKRVVNNLVKRLLGAAGKKVIVVIEGPIGWVIGVGLLGHDIYTIGKEIKEVPVKMKSEIFQSLQRLYLHQAPELVWNDELRDEVKTRLAESRELVSGKFDAAVKELMGCPSFQRITAGLGDQGQSDLVTKLYLLQSRTTYDMCRLADVLGVVLQRVGTRELNCIAAATKTLGLDAAARWIRLAPSRICGLTSIRSDYLLKFEPTPDNLSLLVWVSRLPGDLQGVALSLDADSRDRIRSFDTARQIQMLREGPPDRIREELERLRARAEPIGSTDRWADFIKSSLNHLLAPFVAKGHIDRVVEGFTFFIWWAMALAIIWVAYRIGLFKLIGWLLKGLYSRKSSSKR